MFFKLLLLDIRIEELRASSYTLRRPRATCSPVKIPLRTTCPSNRKVDLVESFRASLLIVCNVGRGLRVPLHVRIGIRNGLETNRQLARKLERTGNGPVLATQLERKANSARKWTIGIPTSFHHFITLHSTLDFTPQLLNSLVPR